MKSIRSPFRAAALAAVFAFLAGSLPAEEAKMSRVFRIPPDFFTHAMDNTVEGEPAADPHAKPSDPAAPQAKPKSRWPRYPHTIQSLGDEFPLDARPLLESYGISFGNGAIALAPGNVHNCSILFVKNSPDQMELAQTIVDQFAGGLDGPSHFHVTWRVQETSAGGRVKELLERTLLCRNGERAKFQRHRNGKLVEMEELEPLLYEGGWVEVNSALEFQFENLRVETTGLAVVRPGDKKTCRDLLRQGAFSPFKIGGNDVSETAAGSAG